MGSGARAAWGPTSARGRSQRGRRRPAPGPRVERRARPAAARIADPGRWAGGHPGGARRRPGRGRGRSRRRKRRPLAAVRSPDHDELLVVRAEAADPLVGQHLTARVVHDLPDVRVLLLGVALLVGMRPPHQPTHVDPSPDGLRREPTPAPYPVRPVAARRPPPVEEPHLVPGAQAGQLLVQPGEVGRPVDQRRDRVPLGPASAVPAAAVDHRVGVAALLGTQEPLLGRRHRPNAFLLEVKTHPEQDERPEQDGENNRDDWLDPV